ncbi:very-long-chain (3R)-3-hydroxyacyl-CoA dehydratase 3 isoform X2 [Aphidius gifuensis]|uniref:very-long-chain (3R)-3-hydroxyacyl-CoA dehydratase 3 isoform X2 n=1 Tax=Aphidius gifuensis TaxID=684658 RepID=UPI001CDC9650|nr:very-long-chain (3R)-3-hydroxyacyl-CoA dehydratase 3 isoform X2 [Aphidius gifuensis]
MNPTIYWSQNVDQVFLTIDVNDPKGTEIQFNESSMTFDAYTSTKNNDLVNYNFTLDLHESTTHENNVYEMIDHKLQFWLMKKIPGIWPKLIKSDEVPSWLIEDAEKSRQKNSKKSGKTGDKNKPLNFDEKLHREFLEKRNVHEDYPQMYDNLHKQEMGYRKDLKKVYLVIYNLCQLVAFLYVLVIMTIRYSREGPESMKETYSSVGSIMKFVQILQFLEVMHPMFGYTKGNAFIALLQTSGRAFILFCMIECEPRMQTKPVVFYVFYVWALVEIFRYPYYITQVLNVDIPLLTWLRYTVWIPLYPLGFLFEGIIVLRNIPYFDETNKFTVALPNSWNFAFHFPTFMRLYLLILCIPGMYTMMSHMNKTRAIKIGKKDKRKESDKKLS